MTRYKIGCSGFSNKHWKGVFYPQGMAQKDWFRFYCERFNTLELNTTFYRFPVEKTLNDWYDKSPDDFRFSVKAPRLITHLKKFNECESALDELYTTCRKGFRDKLSAILFQLPPSMHYNEEKLEKICKSLDPDFMNVLEFRHESWWDEKVYEMLRQSKIVFCSISHPKLPDQVIINSDKAYVRMHGDPELFHSSYPSDKLGQLKEVPYWNPQLKELYVYFNNTASTAGIINAGELKAMSEA
jgi:uncharacterized protein YecE (DUF72 family)